MKRFFLWFIEWLSITLLLVGCGSGGSQHGGDPPPGLSNQATVAVEVRGASELEGNGSNLQKLSAKPVPEGVASIRLEVKRGETGLHSECKNVQTGEDPVLFQFQAEDGPGADFTAHAFSVSDCGGNLLYEGKTIGVELLPDQTNAVKIAMSFLGLVPPSVVTDPATGVTDRCAVLNGTANPNGFEAIAWFEWGTDHVYGSNTLASKTNLSGTVDQSLILQICGLAESTLYHFRAVASNGGHLVFGNDQDFTTAVSNNTAGVGAEIIFADRLPPTVSTLAAGNLTQTGATLNGTVNPEGTDTQSYFEWGADTRYGNTTVLRSAGNGGAPQILSVNLADLAPGKNYHFRLVAFNAWGFTVGNDAVFTTPSGIFREDFEAGLGNWSADNGVWEVGAPTAGPPGCFSGMQCAGTVLDGNYPAFTDSRLISPTMALPPVAGVEEIHLKFRNWFSYAAFDSGQVQVSVLDPASGAWGDWVNEGGVVADTSGWSLKDVDLTAYAGKSVRVAFIHVAGRDCCNPSESTGWYIDDVQVVKKAPEFTGDFEAGWADWGADRGVWQVGAPAAGPGSCFIGAQCAGTELNGNYGPFTDSRLISPTTDLPTVTGPEEIHLRFRNWFSYSAFDSGQVQVSIFDPASGTWGDWVNEGTPVADVSGGWSVKDVDLTVYAGKTVRIAFFHAAGRDCCNPSESTGWYIDDVQVVKKAPEFTGDFEVGWADWGADRGVWQVGASTAGPADCFSGTQCAGTVLDGNYPAFTDSRLISATMTVPTVSGPEEIHLRFWNWFSYSAFDSGQVQVSVWDPAASMWGDWVNEGLPVSNQSGDWSLKDVFLTHYSGKTIRVAFLHAAGRDCCNPSESIGWFIDEVRIEKF